MRVLLGIIGAVIVLGIFSSVLRTLVIPRSTRSGFTRVVQRLVHQPFQLVADLLHSAEAKDRVLAPTQGPGYARPGHAGPKPTEHAWPS